MNRFSQAFALSAIVLGCILMNSVPAATAAATFMSCGYGPVDDPYLEEVRPGKVRYRIHPRHCDWSENGSTAALLNLVKIRWRHWGDLRATARALLVDNHDMDRNGFQRHRVRVEVFDLKPAYGHPGLSRLYYSRIRVSLDGRTGTENLYRPGQPPFSIPYLRRW